MNLRGRNKIDATFSMSAMTDIVFLLLIFFMLTSTAVVTDALDLILPKAQGKITQKQNLSVSITKDLAYYVNNERTSAQNIENTIKLALQEQESPTIILRDEERVPSELAVKIIDIANRNQYKIVLAVKTD